MKNNISLENEFNLLNDFEPQSFNDWKTKVEQDLKGKNFEELFTPFLNEIKLKPIYSKDDLTENDYLSDKPGFIDFRRGYLPHGLISKGWLTAITFPFDSIKEIKRISDEGILKGVSAFAIKLQTPFNPYGLDISTVNKLSDLFEIIDWQNAILFFETAYSPLPFLLIFKSFFNKQQIPISDFKGGLTADPLEFILENGFLPNSFEEIINEIATALKFLKDFNNKIKLLNISTLPISNAGGSIVQELAYALSTGVELLNRLIPKGFSPDTINQSLKFTFGVGSFQFLEIAKFRAARILWRKILEEYNAAPAMFIHAKNSSFNKSALDKHVNILRTTGETFSAIVGGADLIETIPFDLFNRENSDLAVRLARNVQLILKEETKLATLIDPGGGSYYIESLTNQFAEAAWKLFQNIQKKGGIFNALKTGWFQNLIRDSAMMEEQKFSSGANVLVGVNMFPNTNEIVDFAEEEKAATVNQTKDNFFESQFNNKLNEFKLNKSELLSDKYNNFLSDVSLGEILLAFSNESESENILPLEFTRAAKSFEEIRRRAALFEKRNGRKPSALLINVGSFAEHKATADFVRNVFESGGFKATSVALNEGKSLLQQNEIEALIFCKNDWNAETLDKVLNIFPLNDIENSFLAGLEKSDFEKLSINDRFKIIYKGINYLELLNILLNNILR